MKLRIINHIIILAIKQKRNLRIYLNKRLIIVPHIIHIIIVMALSFGL